MVTVICQQHLCPVQIAELNCVAHLLQNRGAAGIALSAVPIAAIAALLRAPGRPSPSAALLGDLLVGGVDLLHFLLRKVGKRIVCIIVRVVLACKLPIGFFDLFVRRAVRHAKDLVGVFHFLLLLQKVPSATLCSTAGRP